MHHTEGIPVEFRKSDSKILYENEELSQGQGSEDEYRPPACEDTGESDSDGESEAPDDTTEEPTTNKPARKGKKPKPGRKDVIAARETTAEKGTKLKRKADENEK